jgi:hypothetical protein
MEIICTKVGSRKGTSREGMFAGALWLVYVHTANAAPAGDEKWIFKRCNHSDGKYFFHFRTFTGFQDSYGERGFRLAVCRRMMKNAGVICRKK